jgi:hypothetical protein
MKMVRSLLLGSAAGIVGVAGASAADLPLKARPAEYVKVCSIYGAGFYYIPGTDTCLKIGGFMRGEFGFNSGAGSNSPFANGANGRETRETAPYSTRMRGIFSFDARTQTEYGTLRSYFRGGWELNSGDPNYRGIQYYDRAFIQFAGLTVGKTQSFFAFYADALNYTTELGGGQFDVGVNLIAYTAQFAGGFSATISLEDNGQTRAGLYDATLAGGLAIGALPGGAANAGAAAPSFGDYRGEEFPDVIGALRVDQPWGAAQIAVAIHDVAGLYQGANTLLNPSAGSATGWAVAGGVKFNLPWSQGDTLWIQGTWAQGAANYLGFVPYVHFAGQFAMYSGNPTAGCGAAGAAATSCGNVGLAYGLDGVFNGASGVQLTEGWDINIAAEHYWTPALRTSLFGHYTVLNFPGNSGFTNGVANGAASGAKGAFCNAGGVGVGAGFAAAGSIPGTAGVAGTVCDPSFNSFQIGVRTIWSPVRNLDIGVELLYTRLDQNMVGNWNLPASGARPAGLYVASDQDTFGGELRFQRNFWP